jgi:hypothetical protein
VDLDYEIFECLVDGSVMWCAHENSLQNARTKLDGLLRETGHDHFAMHLSTRDIIFAGDSSAEFSRRKNNRIFQISYNEQLRLSRAELLRSLGYSVISAIGNEAAKVLLSTLRRDDLSVGLFIVGHAAGVETRNEMVDWLRANYPSARILALNPPNQQIQGVDFNVLLNGPDTWIPLVASTMRSSHANLAGGA